MSTFYLSPTGDDTNPGTSELCPWKTLGRLHAHQLVNGDSIRLQGGATFTAAGLPGDVTALIEIYGPAGITLGSYGTGRFTLQCDDRYGIVYNGSGDTTIADGILLGNSAALIGADNLQVGLSLLNYGPFELDCRNLQVHNLEAQGFALAGLLIGASVRSMTGVLVEDCLFRRNANGIHTTGARNPGGRYQLTNLEILSTQCLDNDAASNQSQAGYGASINGAEAVFVSHSVFSDNGRLSHAGGHAGLMLNDCRNGRITRNRVYRNSYGPSMLDGQGIVIHQSSDVLVDYNDVGNNDLGGISVLSGYTVHEDGSFKDHTPSSRVTVAHNTLDGDMVGLMLCGLVNDCSFEHNKITSRWRGSQTVGLDITNHSGVRCRVYANAFAADDYSTLLSVLGPQGLRQVDFGTANTWSAPNPFFVYGPGRWTTTLPDLLQALQVDVSV